MAQQQLPNVYEIVRRHIVLKGCKFQERPDADMSQPRTFIIQFHVDLARMSTPQGQAQLGNELRNVVIRCCNHINKLSDSYSRVTVPFLNMSEQRRFGERRCIFRLEYHVAVGGVDAAEDLSRKLSAVTIDQ